MPIQNNDQPEEAIDPQRSSSWSAWNINDLSAIAVNVCTYTCSIVAKLLLLKLVLGYAEDQVFPALRQVGYPSKERNRIRPTGIIILCSDEKIAAENSIDKCNKATWMRREAVLSSFVQTLAYCVEMW